MIPSVRITDFDTPARIDEFEQSINATMYLEMGNTVKALLIERTLAGKDVEDKPFVGYSTRPMSAPVARRPVGYPMPSGGQLSESGKTMRFPGGYKEYHGGLGLGSDVTLSVSNQMLGDIVVRAEDDKCVLSFASAAAAEKAHGHHFGTNNLPKREFFDLKSDQSMQRVENKLVDLMVERAARANVPLKG